MANNLQGIWNIASQYQLLGDDEWVPVKAFEPDTDYTAEASTLVLITSNGSSFSDSEGNTISNISATHSSNGDTPTGSGYSINAQTGGMDILSVTGSDTGTGDFTMEAWVNFSLEAFQISSWSFIIGHTYASSGGSLYLRGLDQDSITYYQGGRVPQGLPNDHPITPNNWHHMAAVRNNNIMNVYVDGWLVGTEDISTLSASDTNLYVGHNQSGNEFAEGFIYKPHFMTTAKY